ncbi:hypothetical protein A4A49_38886 [Nicotiana attenuata]|uniref:Uncharacterized protein n=1 Tax=Nicotiana attenuata TaxID=49451 RepID=A0A314KJJ7_NICAT|nr:hypothetical protein A4A49_38886 [Nicotiana attenuata]
MSLNIGGTSTPKEGVSNETILEALQALIIEVDNMENMAKSHDNFLNQWQGLSPNPKQGVGTSATPQNSSTPTAPYITGLINLLQVDNNQVPRQGPLPQGRQARIEHKKQPLRPQQPLNDFDDDLDYDEQYDELVRVQPRRNGHGGFQGRCGRHGKNYQGRNLIDAYDYGYDGNIGNEEHGRRSGYEEYRGLNNIKTSLPTFKVSSDPEQFLEWKIQMERMFELNNVSDTKRFQACHF